MSPALQIGNHLPAGHVQLADRQWRVEGNRLGAGLPAADSAAVPGDWNSGGLRLSVARRGHRRPHHVARRPEWQELHTAAVGLRLRGAGHHGDAHHREQARPHCHHSDCAVHDLLGAPAGLHHGDRGLPAEPPCARSVPGNARAGHAGAVRSRIPDGGVHRAAAEVDDSEEQGLALHPGDAALSLAHVSSRWDCGWSIAARLSCIAPAR